ncbi:MAG: phage antirepressor KilAC domain-containing protein, partial [Ruminococcus flavefaciens]|nr:phage antirepressor KilAC domain-containing protein [Ruminococcus flavefaciens]
KKGILKMNEIKINNTSLKIKEYNGQRVVTFKDVDTVHNRPEGTASRNFRTNKAHFIEGEDFFKICADEIRRTKIFDISPKAQSDIILLTESGYLMLVKSFTDELAWNVQRQLVKSYFKVQRIQKITDSYMIENPAERARRWAEEYEEKLALEQKIEQDKPLVEYASQIQTSEDTISMAEMAKIAAKNGIKIGRTRLFEFLRKKKVLDYKNVPYQRYVEQQPWLEIRESTYYAYGESKLQLTTRVTSKGQVGIVNLLKRQEAS